MFGELLFAGRGLYGARLCVFTIHSPETRLEILTNPFRLCELMRTIHIF